MEDNRIKIIQDLVNQLKNEDWVVRLNAAKILGKIDAEEAIHELLVALKQDDTRDVRLSIVKALDEIDLAVAIPTLIEVMAKDSSMMVRYTAARTLGRMGAVEALSELRKRVLKENNIESVFWFEIAIARLEGKVDGQGIIKLKDMKKRMLLSPKQEAVLAKLIKELKDTKNKKKKE
jgi:HEAT repeat protein